MVMFVHGRLAAAWQNWQTSYFVHLLTIIYDRPSTLCRNVPPVMHRWDL
jgi:hypothetical protein